MKRVLALVLAVLMVAATTAIVPASVSAADTAWTGGGSGTAASPYLISSTAMFNTFIENLKNGSTYSGKYFRLTADVTYNSAYLFEFDKASGLEKVIEKSSSNVVFCIGTGIPGTTYHIGYVNGTTWDDAGEVGTLYTASSLTGTLTAYTSSVPSNLIALPYFGITTNFNGTLDGDGHKISGLYYKGTGANIGLFTTLKNCTIKNLTLTNGFICTTDSNAGSFAATLSNGAHLINCVNENTVCSAKNYAGGIAGRTVSASVSADMANTVIEACTNRGAVSASAMSLTAVNAQAGGIIGNSRGAKIMGCVNEGNVYAAGEQAGGIVGLFESGGSTVAIRCIGYVIGCANYGDVKSSYCLEKWNNVSSPATVTEVGNYVGGIIGYSDLYWSLDGTEFRVENCFNTGKIKSTSYTVSGSKGSAKATKQTAARAGSLVGYGKDVNAASGYGAAMYICGNAYTAQDGLSAYQGLPSNAAVYTSNNITINASDLDFNYNMGKLIIEANEAMRTNYSGLTTSVWKGTDGFPRPVNADIFNNSNYIPFTQKGTENDPIIIDNLSKLTQLRDYVNGGKTFDGLCFVITCDIDLNSGKTIKADGTYTGGTLTAWTPIGSAAYSLTPSVYFGGRICGKKADGSAITIKGLYINNTSSANASGFVGINKGVIENITFANSYAKNKAYGSMVAGFNMGTINNCTVANTCGVAVQYSSAPTTISDYNAPAGGISAVNCGKIIRSINNAKVTSNYDIVGGIAGHNMNLISYCENHGEISGVAAVGGVVGLNEKNDTYRVYGKVEYSGNDGKVSGTGSHIGGTVGWTRNGGGISYSYNAGSVYGLASASLTSQNNNMVSGVLGCGNVNAAASDNATVLNTCYNTGDVYRSGNTTTPVTSSDVSAYIGTYQEKKLKCTTGKADTGNITDQLYVEVPGYEFGGNINLTYREYDANTDITIVSVELTDDDSLKVVFSEPVKYATSVKPYVSIRCCTVDGNGKPTYKSAAAGGVMQAAGTLTLDGTNTGIFKLNSNTYSLRQVLNGEMWLSSDTNGCAILFSIQGTNISDAGGTNTFAFIDNIVSAKDYTPYKGNYGLYSAYAKSTITKQQAQSGELCSILNTVVPGAPYGQKLGTDLHPLINTKDSVVMSKNVSGSTYKTPSDMPSSEDGAFIGYTDVNGKLYAPGSTYTGSQYVSAVFDFEFTADYGASVKVSDDGATGLRWQAKLNKSQISNFGSIVSKGFIIVPTAYVTGDYAIVNGRNVKVKATAEDFTAEALKAKGLKYIDVKVNGWNDANSTSFAASVVNIYSSNYSLSYSARPYVEARYADGTTHYIYGGFDKESGAPAYGNYANNKTSNARTAGYVADKALADLKTSSSGNYTYAITSTSDSYIMAHRSQFAASKYYSKYSSQMRSALYAFIQGAPTITESKSFYPQYDDAAEYAEMRENIRRFVYDKLQSAGALFSVEYTTDTKLGGNNSANASVPFSTISGRWTKSITTSFNGDDEVITATYTDNTAGLRFTTVATIFGDSPTVDFKTTVKNTSTKRSPIITNFKAIDASYKIAQSGGNITLHTLRGSFNNVDDHKLVTRELTTSVTSDTTFAPTTMRGLSSSGAWPYFDFIGNDCGLLLAIGWAGQWEAKFSKTSDGKVNLAAYQQWFNTFLEPDEFVESPRIVLTYFDGDYDYGHNVFRKLMLKHYTPDDDNTDGKKEFTAPISLNYWGGYDHNFFINSFTLFSEAKAKADVVWLDAGWSSKYLLVDTKNNVDGTYRRYKIFRDDVAADVTNYHNYLVGNASSKFNSPGWDNMRGAYRENKLLFPTDRGIFELSDKIDELNAKNGTDYKFMLWWMIENAKFSLDIYDENTNHITDTLDLYPFSTSDYYTYSSTQKNIMLDNEATYQKLLNYYKGMIDQGLDYVRLDNSIGALLHWLYNDMRVTNEKVTSVYYSPENSYYYEGKAYSLRMGYTENKYVHNFYRLWDELKNYSPTFLLDNCASGGRRLDIDSVKRGMPLWRTDFSGHDTVPANETIQYHTQTLSLWLPLSAHGIASDNKYQYRSLYSASTAINAQLATNEAKAASLAKVIDEFIDLRPYWYGNYYQILEPMFDVDSWQAYELYREDWNEGIFVTIARTNTTETEKPSDTTKLYKTLKMKGLVKSGKYLVHNIDDTTNKNDFYATGEELMTKGVQFSSNKKEINCYKLILVKE